MLSARSGRAEDIHSEIFVAHLDVDLLIDDGIREHRCEACVASGLRVEWGDANESMDSGLRLEEPVCVRTFDLEDRALDAGFFSIADIEDLHPESLSLRPPRVHPHEHGGPVLRLGTSGDRRDLQLDTTRVVS